MNLSNLNPISNHTGVRLNKLIKPNFKALKNSVKKLAESMLFQKRQEEADDKELHSRPAEMITYLNHHQWVNLHSLKEWGPHGREEPLPGSDDLGQLS